MRKTVAFSLLLSLFVVLAQFGAAQTRARRVGSTTTASEPAPPATTTTTTASRPPVLGGAKIGTTPSSTTPQPSAAPDEGPEEVGEGDVVRVSTALVSVPVSVMDRAGKYVPDLRQRDFRIFEDGVGQDVSYFASVEKPF